MATKDISKEELQERIDKLEIAFEEAEKSIAYWCNKAMEAAM